MCIRDRPHPIQIKIVTPKELDQILLEINESRAEEESNNISLNPYSVSYTHLDVYKRQGVPVLNRMRENPSSFRESLR